MLLNVVEIAKVPWAVHEPEINHGLGIRKQSLYFIVITGIKKQKMIKDIVNLTLLELEIL